MGNLRLGATVALGAVSAGVLALLTMLRGGNGVDVAWASDLIHEVSSTVWGLMIAGVVVWVLPLRWSDCYRDDLPASVRAAIPLALALIVLAVMGSMGQL